MSSGAQTKGVNCLAWAGSACHGRFVARFINSALIRPLLAVLLLLALCANVLADAPAPSDGNPFPHTTLGDQPLRSARPAAADHAAVPTVVKPLDGLDFSRIGAALLAVIALIFLLRWFGKVFFPVATGKAQNRVVEVVSRSPLAPKQQVMLLRVGRRLLVVGDSAGQLSTLSEITDPDEVATMVGQLREEKSASAAAFGSLFGRFSRKFDSDEAEIARSPEPTDRQLLMDETDEVHETASAQVEIDGLRDRVRALAAQFKRDADPS
jgi:flagellar biogenesis protein FliO